MNSIILISNPKFHASFTGNILSFTVADFKAIKEASQTIETGFELMNLVINV